MEKECPKSYAAVVLAAGQGKRMGGNVHKQYLLLQGRPVLYYSLKAFEDSPVDDIVLVVGKGEVDYCKMEIVQKYGFTKVSRIVAGGSQRYHSVFQGLRAVRQADYVLIHDGARPFVDAGMIARSMDGAKKYGACVAGMPSKDTIKLIDAQGFAQSTPKRDRVWIVQTPQAFSFALIWQAYATLMEIESVKNQGASVDGDSAQVFLPPQSESHNGAGMLNPQKVRNLLDNWDKAQITDDAMLVELLSDIPVKLVEGSYKNVKLTTPEDMLLAEAFVK